MNNDELVDLVCRTASSYLDGTMRTARVLEALKRVDRASFLPPAVRHRAYFDEALPIGNGQTCSQPSMVAFMLDKLDIVLGHRILEIGAGSGYAAVLASILCFPGGTVFASEILPELADALSSNCAEMGGRIVVLGSDGSEGYPEYGPFDRIFLSAGVRKESFKTEPLLAQIVDNGILLYPEERGCLYRIKRTGNSKTVESYHGVSFVSLKGRNS